MPLITSSQPRTNTVPTVAAGIIKSAIVPSTTIIIPSARSHPHSRRSCSVSKNIKLVLITLLYSRDPEQQDRYVRTALAAASRHFDGSQSSKDTAIIRKTEGLFACNV